MYRVADRTQIGHSRVVGEREEEEEGGRGRNDFPSFFLNFVRLVDALDRNEAINLAVSISIMAMENESGNAKVE